MEGRNILLSKISKIKSDVITNNHLALIETFPFGKNSFSNDSRILDATIDYPLLF